MNKKRFITILIIILLTLGALVAVFYFSRSEPDTNPETSNENLFPEAERVNPRLGTPETEVRDPNSNIISEDVEQVSVVLRRLSNNPASGIHMYDTIREIDAVTYGEDGGEQIETREVPETRFRAINIRDSHILEYNSLDGSAKKITNTTIPKTKNTLGNRGGYILQYIDNLKNENIITFLGNVINSNESNSDEINEGEPSKLEGSFLEQNITSIDVGPSRSNFAYIIPQEDDGGGLLVRNSLNSSNPVEIAELPLSNLILDWNEDGYFFQTKADSHYPGSLFKLSEAGEFVPVVSNRFGLTTKVSPEGQYVFMSYIDNGSVINTIYDTETLEETNLRIQTIADKCTWSNTDETILYCSGSNPAPAGDFPEGWYRGEYLFEDQLWKINASTGDSEIISQYRENGNNLPIDATKLRVSSNDEYLMFLNNYDQTPWYMDLVQLNSNDIPGDINDVDTLDGAEDPVSVGF